MRTDNVNQSGERPAASSRVVTNGRSPEMIPLYDVNQFAGLIERERARADRAAVRAPNTVHRKASAAVAEVVGGQPKPSSAGVWGATTHNREFSLVVFRPRTRGDRAGLVELLISTVRTTDAVGIIDVRRLGVLLPDTAAENALLFVKKILATAEEQGVSLSHVVHTYPAAWPADADAPWNDSENSDHHDGNGKPPHKTSHGSNGTRSHHRMNRVEVETGVLRSLVNWLQSAAARRAPRRVERAHA